MAKYNKTNKTTEELVSSLKEKGLIISNNAKAINYIRNIGYFRLKAYFYPLYKEPKHKHLFKQGASFDKLMNMYRFDRKLRLLLFNEIEKIEVAFRSTIVNIVSDVLGDIFWMTERKYFKSEFHFNSSLSLIQSEYEKSKEEFIIHFKNKYSDSHRFPPAWMIAEILPLGNLCHIFMNLMSPKAKKKVAKYFGLQEPAFTSWMLVLGNLRNMCCHHTRTWNRELAINTANPQITAFPWIDIRKTNPKRIYYRICMIQYLLFTVSPNNKFMDKLKRLIDKYPTVDIAAVGFPTDWEDEPLWKA
ncbi:MAG: Abi family protein [Tyzzerella sp.]|nr:Abi family protein [Tyzzerella sp.]